MKTKHATEYCDIIVNELRHLDATVTETPDTDSYRESLEYLEMEHVEHGDELVTWLNESCLEINKVYDDDGYLWGYSILRTCGGPRCEIRRELADGHNFYVETWDDGYAARIVNLGGLANNLDELLTY